MLFGCPVIHGEFITLSRTVNLGGAVWVPLGKSFFRSLPETNHQSKCPQCERSLLYVGECCRDPIQFRDAGRPGTRSQGRLDVAIYLWRSISGCLTI